MSQLRVVPYRRLMKLAERCGFVWQRCQGSHNTFAHPDGRVIHGSKDIVRPLLRKIIRDIGLSREQYHRMLEE